MSARAPHSALGRVALAPWLALACGGDVQEGMSSGPVTVGAANDATDATDATPPDPDSSGSQADTNDSSCGDGVVQEGEECDGEDMGDTSCPSLGFEDGIVTCSPSCRAITNACWTCGDAVLHSAETCDGELFRGESCQSQGFAGGTLKCAEDCRSLDTELCEPFPTCGNGVLDRGEQCDGAELGGHTCRSHGFDNGSVSCHAGCVLDTSGCGYEPLDCTLQGDFCLSDSACCPAGTGGNIVGKCYGFCT